MATRKDEPDVIAGPGTLQDDAYNTPEKNHNLSRGQQRSQLVQNTSDNRENLRLEGQVHQAAITGQHFFKSQGK